MMRNPDPKPGRWVLPLVVLGMVLFTWVWIDRLGPPEVDDTQPVSTTSATTTSTTPADDAEGAEQVEEQETTTTTLLPPEIDVYLENLADDKMNLAEILAELNAANNEWENRDIEYAEAEAAFVAVSEKALAFSQAVELHRPPDGITGLADAHQRILDPATAVATAAEKALAGLRSSDPGDQRREAVVEFRAAAESFNQQVDQITEITLQGFGR
ncbi:MAG: hypothetical protein OXS29_02385 [bacterium]|nr:hypothetical protein [bacterium]MDE0438354.1 hypothetical protein [bacterium]